MSDLYRRIELKEGEPVLFVGVHILRWRFDEWGEPTAAFVEAEPDDKDATIAQLRAQLAAANERAEKAEGQRDALTDAIKDVLQDFDETDFDDFEHTKPLHRCSYCRSNFHWSPTGSPVEHKKRCVAGKLEAALAVINATKGEE